MIVILLSFSVVPFAPGVGIVDSNIGVLFVLAMASLGAYSVMLGGLSSDNKYALLGSLRAAAQMVSYEVFMGISLLGVVALTGSFNLREIVLAQEGGWFVVPPIYRLRHFSHCRCSRKSPSSIRYPRG